MYAIVHEEMLNSLDHLDNETQWLVLLAYTKYLLYGVEPSTENQLVYSLFKAKQFDLDSSRTRAEIARENWKKWWRPRKDFAVENLSKTKKTQVKPNHNPTITQKNQEQEKENNNILSYDNIYSDYYWKSKWIDEKVCNKLINAKLKQWITLDDIKKSMVLYNCQCRIKQDYTYVKKFENRIKEFQKPTDEQLDESLYVVIKEFRDKKKSDDKFWNSSPARTLWEDLKQTFGDDKVKWLRKQANSIQLNFT